MLANLKVAKRRQNFVVKQKFSKSQHIRYMFPFINSKLVRCVFSSLMVTVGIVKH